MTAYGANPGRSGHAMSMAASRAVFASRSACAEFFGAEPENTVFTLNCTHALNIAIKGLARPGAHFVLSDIEHNAVIRPVHSLMESGVRYTLFESSSEPWQTVMNAARAIRPETVALICTAAGNVTGQRMPLPELADLSWSGFSDDERLLIDSLKKNAVTVMIRLMIANKKRNFHV